MAISDIVIEPMQVLVATVDVGVTEGNIQVSFSEDFYNVSCHQYSGEVLDMIRTKNDVELTITIKECTTAKLKQFLNYMGKSYTPAGGGATAVSGIGLKTLRTGALANCVELTLKPIGATNNLRNLTFWKAYPQVQSVTYSGEEAVVAEVKFMIFPDLTKVTEVSKFVYGDNSQTF